MPDSFEFFRFFIHPCLVEVSNNPQMRDWLSSLLGFRGEVDEKKPHFSMKNNVPSIVDS